MTDLEQDLKKRYGTKVMRKKMPLSEEIRRGIFSLLFGLVLITVVLSVVFLLNTSNSAQKGYIHTQLQLQHEQLENLNKELRIKVIKARSILHLENTDKISEMEQPEGIKYIDES